MDKFVYDETFDFYSSVLEGIYYNLKTKRAALDIKGQVYVYNHVPRAAVVELAGASSVGRHYHDFQSFYGPAEYLGPWSEDLLVAAENYPEKNDPTISEPVQLKTKGQEPLDFEIHYEINKQDLSFKTQGHTLQEALDCLIELLSMLGVEFKIKKVVVTFE